MIAFEPYYVFGMIYQGIEKTLLSGKYEDAYFLITKYTSRSNFEEGLFHFVVLGITLVLTSSGRYLESENSHLNDPKSCSFEQSLRKKILT